MPDKKIYLIIDTCAQSPELKAFYYTNKYKVFNDIKEFNDDDLDSDTTPQISREKRFLGPFTYKLIKEK